MFTKLGTIKIGDFERGLVVAVIMAILTIIYESVSVGSLSVDWQKTVTAGVGAGIAYLLKNLSTGEGGKILSNAPSKEDPK